MTESIIDLYRRYQGYRWLVCIGVTVSLTCLEVTESIVDSYRSDWEYRWPLCLWTWRITDGEIKTYLSCVSLIVVSFKRNKSRNSSLLKCFSTSSSLSTTQLLSAFLWACLWKIFSSIVPVWNTKQLSKGLRTKWN